jgi:hypothetical protein
VTTMRISPATIVATCLPGEGIATRGPVIFLVRDALAADWNPVAAARRDADSGWSDNPGALTAHADRARVVADALTAMDGAAAARLRAYAAKLQQN